MKYINKTYKLSWISLNIVTSGRWSEFGFGLWNTWDTNTNTLKDDVTWDKESKMHFIDKCFRFWVSFAVEILWIKLLIHIHI